MKYFVQLLLVITALARPAFGALPQEMVSSDAKWLLHFDVEQLRSTRVGDYLIREVLQKELSKAVSHLKQQLKFEINQDKILQQINSITVYGTDYQSPEKTSVVVLRTDPTLETVIVGALAGLAMAGTNSPIEATQTQIGDVSFYSIGNKAFIAVQPGKALVLGKSRAITEKAARVLAGKASNLKSSRGFSDFADLKKAFFFLGVAEGFSPAANMPPQARLLQLADGGRIALGEQADHLFLNLALRAKSTEVVTQMQQVIQGLIALGSLGQPDNKDLAELIESVKVSTAGNIVSVNVEYPVDSAIHVIDENKDKPFRLGVAREAKGRN